MEVFLQVGFAAFLPLLGLHEVYIKYLTTLLSVIHTFCWLAVSTKHMWSFFESSSLACLLLAFCTSLFGTQPKIKILLERLLFPYIYITPTTIYPPESWNLYCFWSLSVLKKNSGNRLHGLKSSFVQCDLEHITKPLCSSFPNL